MVKNHVFIFSAVSSGVHCVMILLKIERRPSVEQLVHLMSDPCRSDNPSSGLPYHYLLCGNKNQKNTTIVMIHVRLIREALREELTSPSRLPPEALGGRGVIEHPTVKPLSIGFRGRKGGFEALSAFGPSSVVL